MVAAQPPLSMLEEAEVATAAEASIILMEPEAFPVAASEDLEVDIVVVGA